ncbi:hypothetical protein [Streptomyces pseudovenezuelae]|uniref:DUF1524 domain-containing protein n=1 Tax=Streptomyces pseudovenezuelae TaxID=67350 RepID=A0ABT6LXG9_9ACTN|nr:hypothetical protein [Streptomyces pseudovenezuelae]MDH6220997.1 hypothetical protein [Streptomyces pseudovenezuelae]
MTLLEGARAGRGRQFAVHIVWHGGFGVFRSSPSVPLAKRELHANDLDDARDLIALSAASNRAKADQDPSTWLPPFQRYRCQHVTDWIADKTRWSLTIDTVERDALDQQLTGCPNRPITVTLAR